MKGDFSKRAAATDANDVGLLYQQGRVINDADLTAGEVIAQTWRETAARDVVGANVAAVPAQEPDGYMVEAASAHGNHVDIRLRNGRIWADGIHVTLPGDGTRIIGASYLAPPANPAATDVGDIGDGVRDAVILQVELGALNGFQDPARLIEPALGGPDTAERMYAHQSLHLLRLDPGQDCRTIGPRIRDNLADHGRLDVTLEPASVIAGDCPVVEGGGYSGFEHNLYRIEIAQISGGTPMFKWSSQNGGLVGRGQLVVDGGMRLQITANRGAIIHAGFAEFYVEALIFDDHLGRWRVDYGTTGQLNSAQDAILLDAPATFGTAPGDGDRVFFRLWNGVEPISAFAGGATPWRDGIELNFTSPGSDYVAGDFWTFDLRAGEISNPETLFDNAPPVGPTRRRVPLAEILWTGRRNTDISGEIEDCRRRFRPLTNQKLCCTYLVGNGLTTFGDFNSLEEAASHLPPQGGKLCLLPGIHFANLDLTDRHDITIEGCRRRTMVLPRLKKFADPIIRISGGREIEITNLDMFSPFGIAVDVAGTNGDPVDGLRINGCRMLSLRYAIRVEWAHKSKIVDNDIWLLDHINALSAISLRATDSLVEKNTLGVWPFEFKPPIPGGDDDDTPPDPADPCIEPDDLYGNVTVVVGYVLNAWLTILNTPPTQPYRARGGLHLRGGCERISAIRNRIDGGAGHGITLGGLYPAELKGEPIPETEAAAPALVTIPGNTSGFFGFVRDDAGNPVVGLVMTVTALGASTGETTLSAPPEGRFRFSIGPGTYRLSVAAGYEVANIDQSEQNAIVTVRRVAAVLRPDAAFLYQIRILDNTVERMALSGIGFLFHSLKPIAPLFPSEVSAAAFAEFISDLASPRELIGTTNLVRDLEIRGNRLQDNLRVVFTDEMRAIASVVGMGGISLAIVEGLRIENNHITRNGLAAATPSTGIFIGYCEDAVIVGNHISENGPLGDTYDSDGFAGLRGGIVIRMASAIVAGGEADSQQKAAADIRGNHIDQPAGRALSVLAYGPVTCVGNHLNSEREGKGSFLEQLVGVVLILNLGGIHRHFDSPGSDSFLPDNANGVVGSTAVGLAKNQRVEALMPGGETLINSNRLRMGGENLAFVSQLIVTLDDLGYDANQSSVFNPTLHFANLVGLGQSVRVSDNRLRERARLTAASAITYSFGMNASSKRYAMNMTTHNQADHCIIAMTNGGGFGKPALDLPNQIVNDQFCPVLGNDEDDAKTKYLTNALLVLLAGSQQFPGNLAQESAVAEQAVPDALEKAGNYQNALLNAKADEATRLETVYGQADVRVVKAQADMQYRAEVAATMRDQAKVAKVLEVAEPENGLVLDGRILDGNMRAYENAVVELVDRNGQSLNITAKADASGYYALPINEEELKRLQRLENVTMRVVSVDGLEQKIDAKPLLATKTGKVRTDVSFDIKRGFSLDLKAANIFPGRVGGVTPIRETTPVTPNTPSTPDTPPTGPLTPRVPEPERPEQPEQPAEPIRPTRPTVVQLEEIEGIGPRIAARLRFIGINDASGILDADTDKLREVLGSRAEEMQRRAKLEIRRRDALRRRDT